MKSIQETRNKLEEQEKIYNDIVNLKEQEEDIQFTTMFSESELRDEFPTAVKINSNHFHVDLFPGKVTSVLLEITNVGKTGVTARFICESKKKTKSSSVKKQKILPNPEINDDWQSPSQMKSKTIDTGSNELKKSKKLKESIFKPNLKHKKDDKIDEDEQIEDIEIDYNKDVSIPKWISMSQQQVIIPLNDREPKKIEIQFKSDILFETTKLSSDVFHETLILQVKSGEDIPITLDFTLHKNAKQMDKYFDNDGFAKQMQSSILAWKTLFPWGKFDNLD